METKIKKLNMHLDGDRHSKLQQSIEIEKHTEAGWLQFCLIEVKRGRNKNGEETERMYQTFFSMNKEQVERLRNLILNEAKQMEQPKKYYFKSEGRPTMWVYESNFRCPTFMEEIAKELRQFYEAFFINDEISWRDCVENITDEYEMLDFKFLQNDWKNEVDDILDEANLLQEDITLKEACTQATKNLKRGGADE